MNDILDNLEGRRLITNPRENFSSGNRKMWNVLMSNVLPCVVLGRI